MPRPRSIAQGSSTTIALTFFTTITLAQEVPDVFTEDLSRYRTQATSPLPELRVGAARALSLLGHRAAVSTLVALLKDCSAEVRREAAFGLGRIGGRRAVEALIASTGDADPWVRAHAEAALQRRTGWRVPGVETPREPGETRRAWEVLWKERSDPRRERELLDRLTVAAERDTALRELAILEGPRSEAPLLELFQTGKLGRAAIPLFLEALGPVAGPESVRVLARLVGRHPRAAWILGDIGGEEAENALLDGLAAVGPRLSILVNLDRLHSRALYQYASRLLFCFGLVSYRSHPDDLHLGATPLQRVAARLLLRSGRAEEVVDLLLRKLEGKLRTAELPEHARAVAALLDRMDPELRPGFHREDGYANAQPLAALPHLVVHREWAPRLLALLDHPAYVARVYAGTALARLRTAEGAVAILEVLRQGYPFPDATMQVSGKHGPDVSGKVRWKGYLAMALGLDGSEAARRGLEELLVDPAVPRDIRYGAAVGLGRIGDLRSRSALKQAACSDIVRWIREEAERSLMSVTLGARTRAAEKTQGEIR